MTQIDQVTFTTTGQIAIWYREGAEIGFRRVYDREDRLPAGFWLEVHRKLSEALPDEPPRPPDGEALLPK